MFFLGLVIHYVLLFAPGFLVRRVQDLFFETGMNGDFHFQLGQQFAAFFDTTLGGFA
ncbi:hypothetical protein D3C87_2134100 [compost metagenome]